MTDALPELKVVEGIPGEESRAILEAIRAHNNVMLGPTDRREIAIPIRNDKGETDGGLVGYTGRGWLFIEMMLVPERLRGRGMAGRLLQMAEDEARARGCTGAYIDTINPQARRAYQRQGYEVFGKLENFTGDFTLTWLKKQL